MKLIDFESIEERDVIDEVNSEVATREEDDLVTLPSIKTTLKRHKYIIRIISILPLGMITDYTPVKMGLTILQLTCFCLMFWIGWHFEGKYEEDLIR